MAEATQLNVAKALVVLFMTIVLVTAYNSNQVYKECRRDHGVVVHSTPGDKWTGYVCINRGRNR